jgi:hypothetical protein
MNKQEHLMYFLGQLKANIEHIAAGAANLTGPIFEQLSELETFFNENIQQIFFGTGSNDATVTPDATRQLCKYNYANLMLQGNYANMENK